MRAGRAVDDEVAAVFDDAPRRPRPLDAEREAGAQCRFAAERELRRHRVAGFARARAAARGGPSSTRLRPRASRRALGRRRRPRRRVPARRRGARTRRRCRCSAASRAPAASRSRNPSRRAFERARDVARFPERRCAARAGSRGRVQPDARAPAPVPRFLESDRAEARRVEVGQVLPVPHVLPDALDRRRERGADRSTRASAPVVARRAAYHGRRVPVVACGAQPGPGRGLSRHLKGAAPCPRTIS